MPDDQMIETELSIPILDLLPEHKEHEVDNVIVGKSPLVKAALPKLDKLRRENEYENLKHKFNNVDAIRVLAGGTAQLEDGSWVSPDYSETDNNGLASGATARVVATAVIGFVNNDVKIEVGSHYRGDTQPSPSHVMAEELVHLGIDDTRIKQDRDSFDTVSEIARFLDEAIRNDWKNINIVTNEYHIPRINAFLDSNNLEWLTTDEELTLNLRRALSMIKTGELNVKIIAAENVVKDFDEDIYDEFFKNLPDNDKFIQRMEKERLGMMRIETEGEYTRLDDNGNEMLMKRGG